MVSRLVNVDRDLAVIPNVAIHMDRSANDGKSYNANVDMLPLIGSAELKTGFKAIVAQSLGVAEDALLAGDLDPLPARTRLRLGRGERVRLLRTA